MSNWKYPKTAVVLAVLSVIVGIMHGGGLIDFALAVAVTFGFWYGLIWLGGRIFERSQR